MAIFPEQTNMVRGVWMVVVAVPLWIVPDLLAPLMQGSSNPLLPWIWQFFVLGLKVFAVIFGAWGAYDVIRAFVLTGEYSARSRVAAKEQLDHLQGPMIRDRGRRAFDHDEPAPFSPVPGEAPSEPAPEPPAVEVDMLGEELITELEPESISVASRLRAMREARGSGDERPSRS